MLARFGQVLYWSGYIAAGLLVVFVAFNSRTVGGAMDWWTIGLGAGIATAIWLIGRAALYVLAGGEGTAVRVQCARTLNATESMP